MKHYLQVYVNELSEWRYVFAYSATEGIITTTERRKSLLARDYKYFCDKYANHQFRVVTN